MGCEQGSEERCALCGAPAAVHCAADAAFLCAACDAKVHGANFLASRHRRTRLSAVDVDQDGYDSEASSCVSTADSTAPSTRGGRRPKPENRRRPPRAEEVLESWAKRMGVPAGTARRRAAAAARAVRACGADVAAARVPLRVAMAAALWREVAAEGAGAGQGDALRRLEACTHVPARIVVAVASSMALSRSRRRAHVDDAAEGWDECSWAGPKSDPARS